ncbi:MAG: RNA 2',3'-cyclic phosphodiesterase [Verrucomicrobiota bacterium]
MRLFVGIPLDGAARAAVAQQLPECRRRLPNCRWVDAGNLHLTVRFLGEAPEIALPEVTQWFSDAVSANPSGSLELAEPGWFQRRDGAVFWVGIKAGDWLPQLAHALATPVAGLEAEEREFKPHVTLGRYRFVTGDRQTVQAFRNYFHALQFPGAVQSETWVCLYRSHLGSDGSRYEVIASSRDQSPR